MNIQDFDYSVNLLRALIWRFDGAPALRSIAEQKQLWYEQNQSKFWQDWYDNVFNPQTMNEFGCSVWGRILDIQMDLPFGSTQLATAQKRLVIQLRYFQLVTRGTVPEINEFMSLLFADQGKAFVWDNQDMSITYVFESAPDPGLLYIASQYDLFPRTHGVKTSIHLIVQPCWGFGPYYFNYDNGPYGVDLNV